MKEKIKNYLKEIENNYNIKILYACETGSRAWGFPSPDSDYDIRMIYIHPKDWYLSLWEEKDTIEMMLNDNEIDITGWDLRKSLRLLLKSNPPLLERIQSPIIYRCDEPFLSEIILIAKTFYSKIATIHHYLNMAKKCLYEIDNIETYKLKKFFYALRSAIACKWILDRDELPPICFLEMLEKLNISQTLKTRIAELIELKSNENESYMHCGENELIFLIKEIIMVSEDNAQSLPTGKGDFKELNDFFRNAIQE